MLSDSQLLVELMQDFLDFLKVVNDLDLSTCDVFNEVFFAFDQAVRDSCLCKSFVMVENLLQPKVSHRDWHGRIFTKILDVLRSRAIVDGNRNDS